MKKTIINDLIMYVKSRVSGLRVDYYYNRKGCDNEERGHFATEDGKVVCDRPAPALNVTLSGSSTFLSVSGSALIPI